MRTVLCYDVTADRRRARFHKRLKGFLRPVQESVFEGDLDDPGLRRVERLVERELDLRHDAVRIYRLCAACAARNRLHGVSVPLPDPNDPQVF